jgi:hypothetical protein
MSQQAGTCDAPALHAMLGIMLQKARQATSRLVPKLPLPVPLPAAPRVLEGDALPPGVDMGALENTGMPPYWKLGC